MSYAIFNIASQPVGVFDSGVGGISVLNALRRVLPKENYVYFSDAQNAPYGKKTDEEIMSFTLRAIDKLVAIGCKSVVVACNTATAVAIDYLRTRYTIPIIGLEPALKPAEIAFPNGKVLLLATPVTLRRDKFKELYEANERGNVVCVSAPELVTFVERGEEDTVCAVAYLKHLLSEYRKIKFDACVLGCTHFPFARTAITQALGYEPVFFDGADGAARRLKSELAKQNIMNSSAEDGVVLWNEIYNSDLQNRMSSQIYTIK